MNKYKITMISGIQHIFKSDVTYPELRKDIKLQNCLDIDEDSFIVTKYIESVKLLEEK